MIKVMIVDDEYLAREVMKKTVNWAKYQCQLCTEASNGIEGIEKAKEFKPDIIVTDIKMPGKDGIEMAKEIQKFLPNCKFIIITGYDEFEYARSAVKINAFDFILKPIDENEFLNSISKISKKIIKIKKEDNIFISKILLDIMRGKRQYTDDVKNKLYMNMNFKKIIIAIFKNDKTSNLEENLETNIHNDNIIKIIKGNYKKCYCIEYREDNIICIIPLNDVKENISLYNNFEYVRCIIKKQCNTTVTIGISLINDIKDIRIAYKQAKGALKNRLYKGKDSIIFYENVNKENSIAISWISKKEKELMLSIRACDKNKAMNIIKYVYIDMFKNGTSNIYIIKQVSIEIVIKTLNILKEYNNSVYSLFISKFNIYEKINKFSTVDDIYDCLLKIVLYVIKNIKIIKIEYEDQSIEKAIKYINQNYCNKISLKEVANSVYLNESYLSRKIKKVLGISFVEYITKLRMEKAVNLLKNPNVKVTSIASKLGYPNYRYFSKKFKEYTGYLPSEFNKV